VKPHLYFTVTNDLTYDQRMHRICHSLANNGYEVTLVGRCLKYSLPLRKTAFNQKRLRCFFNKGFLFYAEYNVRLLFFLLSRRMNGICAIDLDTILPCLLVSKIKGIPRIYDAHEYFTELKEVITRPKVYRIWKAIESFCVPKFKYGYTVSPGITSLFHEKYNRQYTTIRNLPINKDIQYQPAPHKYLFFGGVVNEARGFEVLIPAMKKIPYPLVIAGDGNFMAQLESLIHSHKLEDKIILKGMVKPEELRTLAEQATLGIGLAEKEGMNQFLALPNKFFDYLHAGLPQITMNYPEYIKLNSIYKVGVLISDLNEDIVAKTILATMEDESLLNEMRLNCMKAKKELNWEQESLILIDFYNRIFKPSIS